MRIICLLIAYIIGLSSLFGQPDKWIQYTDSVKHAWGGENSKLLTAQEQENFKGVKYLAYDEAYRLVVDYKLTNKLDTVLIPTTGGRTSRYLQHAVITFELHDTACSLLIYRGLDPWSEMDLEFVMFNDASNGETSYGGGRYLELQQVNLADQTAVLDLNYSYNPYCAYADKYSCPVPPAENRLTVAVRAGVAY